MAATDPWCWRGRLLELERTFAKFHNHAKVRVQPYRVPRAPTADTTGAGCSALSAAAPGVFIIVGGSQRSANGDGEPRQYFLAN